MTQEEYDKLLSMNTLVYLTKDYKGYNLSKGDIVKPVATLQKGRQFVCVRRGKSLTTFDIAFEDVEILKSNNGRLQVVDLGDKNDGCSLTCYNGFYNKKVKIGDCTTSYILSDSLNVCCNWENKSWFTNIDLLRFIPDGEEEPKAKEIKVDIKDYIPNELEEPIPTPLKAIKQATGLSIGMNYTYTPTDAQSEFLGIIEGFMITKKGIFVVDCTGDVIPADKCKKAK